MNKDNASTKNRIFQAALELIESEENVTARQIAKKANVNLALINYYYQSKENLLSQVTWIKMESIIGQVLKYSDMQTDALMRLKKLLTATADFSFKHNEIFKIAVSKEIKDGCKNSCSLVMPMLKEIFKHKSESELKIVALQLIIPFHQIVLNPEIYGEYLNTDFFDDQQRTQMIIQMIDSILG